MTTLSDNVGASVGSI